VIDASRPGGQRLEQRGLTAGEFGELGNQVVDDPALGHFAACELAVVQGGLTTCMELVANRRPFLYFPLAHHFEQNLHVTHRLDRYRAGRRMDYATADPDAIAEAIASDIGRPVDYRSVETDGAARAPALIAEVL
jgi:predicted glycosyltransferase